MRSSHPSPLQIPFPNNYRSIIWSHGYRTNSELNLESSSKSVFVRPFFHPPLVQQPPFSSKVGPILINLPLYRIEESSRFLFSSYQREDMLWDWNKKMVSERRAATWVPAEDPMASHKDMLLKDPEVTMLWLWTQTWES